MLVVLLIALMVLFFAPKIKEKLEISSDLRKAVIHGAKNVEYHESTLKHIRKNDRKLKAEFRIVANKVSILGEYWADPVLDGYGINLECSPDFKLFFDAFKEVLNSSCPYEECSEALRFIRAFEENFYYALMEQRKAEERARNYKPYSWLGDFLPEVAMTEE